MKTDEKKQNEVDSQELSLTELNLSRRKKRRKTGW